MLPLFAVPLLQLAQTSSTNTTLPECPSCEATACNHRSLWSLLAGCGITLLICVWHAIHPSVPLPRYKRINVILYRLFLMFLAFFTPELMIMDACGDWLAAKRVTKRVHAPADSGYMWWTMTHSYFVLIGGFALCDDTGIEEINMDTFLSLVKKGDIMNPVMTEHEIKDKSASNSLAKVIFVVQLSWFITQIIVRLVHHLAVTLVELDTVCLALFTVPLIFFWWKKPRCPGYPHIFYTRRFMNNPKHQDVLQEGNALATLLHRSTIKTSRHLGDRSFSSNADNRSKLNVFVLTWLMFGALHALAWNYDFPTEMERHLWRVSSLALMGTPVLFEMITMLHDSHVLGRFFDDVLAPSVDIFLFFTGVIFRLMLVGLMLASLRSLPPSAYEIVPWTNYIPHL